MNGMESELHSLTNIHISGMSFEARPCTERREAYDYGGQAIEGALGHTAFHFHFKAAGLVCEQALRSRSSSITPSLGMQYYSLFRSYRRISVEKVHFREKSSSISGKEWHSLYRSYAWFLAGTLDEYSAQQIHS
jgi:hypothetical protein